MGPPPKEGVLRNFFFALKNPTASAGFEPANLGTKGHHATSRPPKPPQKYVNKLFIIYQNMHFIIQYGRYEHKIKILKYVVTNRNVSIFDWIIYAEISLSKRMCRDVNSTVKHTAIV
jgi:hypothetical protein